MTDGLAGLRRQLTFEEAAQLADVEGPSLHYDYPALRLTQSPLFQRMGEKLDEEITAQNVARMGEVERQHNITNLSMQSGLNRQDLEEIIAQLGRVQGAQGPASSMGSPGPAVWALQALRPRPTRGPRPRGRSCLLRLPRCSRSSKYYEIRRKLRKT